MDLEFLKPVLGEDLFAQVTAALEANGKGINLVNIADGTYIPKAKFDEKLAAIRQLEAEKAALVKERDEATAKLATVDEKDATIAKLTADLEAQGAKLKGVTLDQMIMDALRAAKVKNAKIIMPQINRDAITETDGKLTGLDEQLAALKKSDPYLFEEAKPAPRGGYAGRQDTLDHEPGDGGNTNTDVNNAIRSLAGRGIT